MLREQVLSSQPKIVYTCSIQPGVYYIPRSGTLTYFDPLTKKTIEREYMNLRARPAVPEHWILKRVEISAVKILKDETNGQTH